MFFTSWGVYCLEIAQVMLEFDESFPVRRWEDAIPSPKQKLHDHSNSIRKDLREKALVDLALVFVGMLPGLFLAILGTVEMLV